jgi:uncharacterized coiled-coil protein SlyX
MEDAIPIPELKQECKPEPYDPSRYPVPKDCCVVSNCEEKGEMPPRNVALLDLPVRERKKYMWTVPKECRKDCCYDMEPDEYKEHVRKIKAEPEEKRKKEERDKKQKDDEREKRDKDKDTKLEKQAKTIESLTNTIITQAQDIQSLHASLSQVINLLNKNNIV